VICNDEHQYDRLNCNYKSPDILNFEETNGVTKLYETWNTSVFIGNFT